MANKHKGEVEFDSDGESYILRYSTNALCELEAVLKKPFNKVLSEFSEDNLSVVNTRAMFYAGLTEFHSEMSISDTGDLLDRIGIDQGLIYLNEAIALAFPTNNVKEKKKETPPK